VKRVAASFAAAALVTGCGAPSSVPTGPGQIIEIQIQPAVVPPNPKGALALGVVTGCVFEFQGPAQADRTFRYLVRPSERVPEVKECIARLNGQPGVDRVTVP
jgi:hypothetical protein